MSFDIVIPVRFHSSRLPGKVLLEIEGKPMVEHVFGQACKSGAVHVVVATDDSRIAQVCEGFGAEVCMTQVSHPSGTERLVEVVEARGYDDDQVVVNVQGDEPLIPPENIDQVAQLLVDNPDVGMATLQEPIRSVDELFDPHVVKVVSNESGEAVYFSRAAIPWDREAFGDDVSLVKSLPKHCVFFRHVGLYAYRVGFLKQYSAWPASGLESVECLEQLRVLFHGEKILVGTAEVSPYGGVDTEADLKKVRAYFKRLR